MKYLGIVDYFYSSAYRPGGGEANDGMLGSYVDGTTSHGGQTKNGRNVDNGSSTAAGLLAHDLISQHGSVHDGVLEEETHL